jgi:uncharacterized protein YyaL (SSP411 family)
MGRGVPMMAAALSTSVAGIQQIVLAEGDPSTLREPQGRPEPGRGATGSGQTDDTLDRFVAMHYLPFAIQLRITPDAQRALAASLPFLASMQPLAGVTAAYVCRDFTCRQPVTTVDALEQELGITA